MLWAGKKEGLCLCQKRLSCHGGDVMHVEGEGPQSPNSKDLESGAREHFLLRARGVYGYVLSGGAPPVASNTCHPKGPLASHDTVCSYV
jgi:hypothetical protein